MLSPNASARTPLLLALVLLVGGVLRGPAWGVAGQLHLWADRSLVTRIIDSIPPDNKDYEGLRCPRHRPDITQHIPAQLYLVFNGIILQEVYEKILHSVHRPLPPQIEIIRLKWRSGFERLTYNISMTSLNKRLLFDPLLNVASYGMVPAMESDVQITLACTGKYTGFAKFKLHLDVRREFEGLRKIPRIDITAQKYCLSKHTFKKFHIKCDCRVQCKYYMRYANTTKRKEQRKKCNSQCRRNKSANSGADGRYNYYHPSQPRGLILRGN